MPPSESDLRFESSPPTIILREPLRYFSEQVKECLLLQRCELAFALASSAPFIAFIMKNLAFTGPWMDLSCSLLWSPVSTVVTQALFTDASVSGAGTEELLTEQLLFLGLWYLRETLAPSTLERKVCGTVGWCLVEAWQFGATGHQWHEELSADAQLFVLQEGL